MKELEQIYKSMLPREVDQLKQLYKLGDKNKRLTLLGMLEQPELPTNTKAAKLIYKQGEVASTFTHLKQRVRDDLLAILLLQDTERHSRSAYRQAEIDCRRKILEGDILLKKGIYDPAIKALERAYKLADTYELPNERILVGDLLRTHLGFKKGEKVYRSFEGDVERNYALLGDLLEVKKLYYNILLPNMFNRNITNEYIDECKAAFERMQVLYEGNNSPNVAYFMYLTGLYYYTFVADWEQAISLGKELLQVVEAEPSINSYLRVANANLQTGSGLMKLYRFEEAATHAEVAVEIFKGGAMNELISMEQLLLAAFNANHLDKCEQVISKALAHSKIRSSDTIYGKWLFYKAGTQFKTGDTDNALNTLHQDSTLLKDRSGWLFGHRLLEIMILIERKEFDLTDFRVEALRKLLQRQKHKEIARIKTIFQVLHQFVKTGYHKKETLIDTADKMELLAAGQGDHYWDPLGYELIRFDTWFKKL